MAGSSAGSIFVDLLLRDASFKGGLRGSRQAVGVFAVGAGKDLAQTKRAFADVLNPVNNLTAGIRTLGTAVAGFLSAQKIVQLSDQYRGLEGRLSIVIDSNREMAKVQDELYQIALRTRQPLEGVYNLYTRIAQSLPESQRAQFNLLEITENFNKALAITGEGSAQASSAVLQFTQAVASGFKASGQEINALLDSAPRVAKAIQQSFGDGTKSLKTLNEEGALSIEGVLRALENLSGQGQLISEEFERTELTVGQALTNLGTAFTEFIGTNEAVNAVTGEMATWINEAALAFEDFGEAVNRGHRALKEFLRLQGGGIEGSIITPDMFAAVLPPEYTEYSDGDIQAAIDRAKQMEEARGKLSDAERKKREKEAERAQKALADLYKKNRTYIEGLDKETIQYMDTEKELNDLYRKGAINVHQLYTALDNLDQEYDELGDSAEAFGFNLEEFSKEASRNLQSAFKDFFKNTDEGLDGLVDGFADALAEMAANAAATNLAELLFGDGKKDSGGGLFGKIFDSISLGGDDSSGEGFDLLGLFDGFFSEGGKIRAGHWGIAGENGPEPVFGGTTGATVVPNKGMGGTNYYIDARGADQSAIAGLEIKLEALAGKGVIERRVSEAQNRGAL